MGDIFLGIDLGTTSVKAALLDSRGQCIASFCKSYETHRPNSGYAEQNPADWTHLIDEALAEISHRSGVTNIRAGALTSQVNTHTFIDKNGQPLMPAIMWQDTRASAQAEELDAKLTVEEKIQYLGAPIPVDASHPLARMLWVKRNKPDIWEKTAKVLLPKDFALLHLTGNTVTDALSNIGLASPVGDYVPQILDLVEGAADRMAPIKGLTGIIGEISSGPLKGTPMVNATMDGWVGLLGAGAAKEGAPVYLSGTSEILGISSNTITNEPGVVVFAKTEGLTLHAGPTQSGSASQDWFCKLAHIDHSEMARLAASTDRGPLFLPQLAGERAPLWNADLRGAFLGVDTGMSTPEFARAVYEGVAFSARHLMEALEASSGASHDIVTCGGGGFRADIWGQIRADIFGKTLKRLAVNEPGIVGAVCLAAYAAGDFANLFAAQKQFAEFDRIWEPRLEKKERYDKLYEIYRDAIDANETIGKRLTGL